MKASRSASIWPARSGRRSRWWRRQRPERLVADRGYDSAEFQRVLRRRGIGRWIPAKRQPKAWRAKCGRPVVAHREEYVQRWNVERSFAWTARFRRLARDYERLPETLAALHFQAFAILLLTRFVTLMGESA